MPRNISFALTRRQYEDGSKDVTRRLKWLNLKDGDLLCPVAKAMGLKPGEQIERLSPPLIRVWPRREPLRRMIDEPDYGREECRREGFPGMTPGEFVEFFCASHKGCTPDSEITRIEFERLEPEGERA